MLEKNLSRLDYLDNYLKGRDFLLDHFSVADAYLVTVINWTMATPPIELAKWPNVKAYYERLRAAALGREGGCGGVRAVQGRARAQEGGGMGEAERPPRAVVIEVVIPTNAGQRLAPDRGTLGRP